MDRQSLLAEKQQVDSGIRELKSTLTAIIGREKRTGWKAPIGRFMGLKNDLDALKVRSQEIQNLLSSTKKVDPMSLSERFMRAASSVLDSETFSRIVNIAQGEE